MRRLSRPIIDTVLRIPQYTTWGVPHHQRSGEYRYPLGLFTYPPVLGPPPIWLVGSDQPLNSYWYI